MEGRATVLTAVIALVALEALVFTPLLSWRLVAGAGNEVQAWLVGVGFAGVAVVALWRWRAPLLAALQQLGSRVEAVSPARWLFGVILVGLFLRLAWVALFPAQPSSDGATYWLLANRLARGDPYHAGGTFAFWPPGYPLSLSVLIRLFGDSLLLVPAVNLLLFVWSAVVAYALGQMLFGGATGRLAALFLAVSPNLIALSGLPEKELVLVAVLPTAVWLYLRGEAGRRRLSLIGAGMLLGYGTLIQPSVQLFPIALLAIDWLRGQGLWRSAVRIAVVGLAMLTVIAPWTLRNYQIFGELVLIGTNGGSTLYRANNPLATGGYTQEGEVSLDGLGEIEASRKGYELAKAWIRENPDDFLALAVKKQILFMGDDSTGMYATLKRGGLAVSDRVYMIAKGAANGFWLLLWTLVLLSVSDRLRPWPGATAVAAMPLLYFLALHSVFEGSSKYHVPAITFVLILAATAFQVRRNTLTVGSLEAEHRNAGVHGQ